MKLGVDTNSYINHLYSTIDNKPQVGKGATRLLWSDRHAYEVVKVSKDEKTCFLQRYYPKRIDGNGMSDAQEYEYKQLDSRLIELRFRYGAWQEKQEVVFFENDGVAGLTLSEKKKLGLYGEDGNSVHLHLVDGYTVKKIVWHKWNIVFGVREEYYDFTM